MLVMVVRGVVTDAGDGCGVVTDGCDDQLFHQSAFFIFQKQTCIQC